MDVTPANLQVVERTASGVDGVRKCAHDRKRDEESDRGEKLTLATSLA
jgi:hypothetical protein